MKEPNQRRRGDTIAISGDYQYKALKEGNAVQRFWHWNKQYCINRLLPPDPNDNILDVGCGSGVISSFLAKSGARVLGIDCNEAAVAFAKGRFQASNLAFQCGLVDESFTLDEPMSKIYCLELIEHLPPNQGRKMLEIFHTLLTPGGEVFLTTPNYRSPWPVIEWLMDTLKLAPSLKGDQHVEGYHRRKLKQLCEGTGFRVEKLITTCMTAPWLALLSWNLASKINSLETGRLPFLGCILVGVLKKVET